MYRNRVNQVIVLLLILTLGSLASACLASEEPGRAITDTTSARGASEPTQVSEPAPTMTEAATVTPEASTDTTSDQVASGPTQVSEPAPTVTEAAIVTPGATIMSPTASAANADVEFVRAVEAADGTWTFEVTVRHPDTGWEDYADGWDVVTLQGIVLKRSPDDTFTRLLLHPHETEQPFTRNQVGIVIPQGVTQVIVRAHDIVDGFGGQEVTVDLTAGSGPGFEVLRQ